MDSRTSPGAGNPTARFGNAADRAGFRQHGRSSREDDDRKRHRDGRRDYERNERRSYRDRSYSSEGSDDHRRRVTEDRGYRREKRSDHDSDKPRRDHRRDRSTNSVSRRRRERSDSYERSPTRRRSRSPPRRRRRRSASTSKSPSRTSRVALPSQDDSFRRETGVAATGGNPPEKQKPNFKPTGLLAKEANTVAGTATVLKYHEPPEARKPPPKEAWRMYVFKKKDLVDTVHLHQRSCWLLGRDQKVTDLLLEHPSISKQHAVIQFRYLTMTNEYGDKASKVKPYLIDLESANGTGLNGKKIETSRFVELVDADVIKFGDSEREYVVMLPSVD